MPESTAATPMTIPFRSTGRVDVVHDCNSLGSRHNAYDRPTRSASMATVGSCHICGAAGTTNTCEQCGGLVCERHYDRSTGLCRDCLAGQR